VRRVYADFRPGLGALTREGSWFDAAKRNIDLIELAIQIDKEKRNATTEEQAQLAKYVGFGASEIRNALFPIPGEYAKRLEPNRLVWPNLVRDARWKPLAERIDALPREWQKSILQSTQYAHYTSEGIIRSIWSAIQRLGFTGGNIFEPGTGIGSFSMLMPDGIHETSRFTGVEFDAPTALIARLLSPDQQIHHDDFIKRKFPKNYFDVNVGNPPFSQTKILGDAEYAKHGFMLHDFFFAKGIDLVRPGGLQVFVTSKGTMDKKTDRARKFLSDRADLIGAIRLPSTAFEGNAGTSVVTDVIFLKKRAPGEAPGGMAWGAIKTVDTKDGPVEVNEYFADHPEMILGQQRISGNIDDLGRRVSSNGYGGEKYTVVSYDSTPAELDAKFAEAVERLPENVYSPLRQSDEAVKAETRKVDFDPSVKREGVIYLDKDGAILRVSSGVGVPLDESVKLSDKDRAWLKGYVGIRDLVQAARLAQVTDGDWKAALRALNKAYDAFRAERGPILDFRTQVRKSTDEDGNIVETESRIFKNKRLYREDYDSALLTSLESISESGEIVKAPFLLGRTIGKPVVVEVKGIGDALAVSLDSIGSLDLADVGRRIGLSMEDTIEALGNQIYRTPAGQWQLADEYLSGDVVTKLEEAEHLARSNPDYRRNVEALKEVQPEKLGPSQISVKLGAAWVPVEHVNEFAKEIGAGHVTFDIKTETWQVDGGNRRTERRAGAEYGTTARSASELLEAALNSRSIKVTAVVDKKTVTDVEATTAANEMAKKIKDKFKRWVWTDRNRASELVEAYNKRFNNIAPRKFDGSHLTLPGVSLRFKLHPHQLRSIWRQIQTGNTYLAHAVGAGKTIEMIAGAMEQKRLGLIKKPMFVVPNHMLEQFSNEFMELYPLANIMVADDENFSSERRKAFVASATLNSPDAIIITHSAFKRIGVTEASVAPIRDEIVTDLEMELASLAKDQGTRVRRSQLEQQIEAVNQRFDAILGASGKDSTIKFEDIGADFIYADEAHAFRKLDFHTAQQIKGIDPNGSQAAMDMYVKTRILERARPGRAFVFASGTPVTNTMGELFTIMRFFAPQEMELSGISTFDSWARQFGEVAPALEPNAAGKYELIERFAKFDNVPELMSRVRQFMDVLTSESLGALVKRPNLAGGKPNLVVVEPTKALEAYMKGELSRRIEASKAWKPSPGQMSNPDPIVSIITDGRFAAIDPRFFGAELEGESIITKMASNVVAKYHATKGNVYHDKEGNPAPIKGSTQIVFYNLGFGEQSQRSRGFNSRAAFTKLLTDGGIPRDEIAWFDDANTDAKKEAIFKDMRSGKLKVLIGSAKKMGTGVNVQNRLIALHYQDPPWFPADVEQPHGRIIRQGNLNQEVSIDWYTTKGTYQSTMWQMVGRKQRFIDQAFTGDKSLRSMDDMGEASLFEQAAAVASGDPRALQLAGLRQDVERFERLQAAHASEQINIRTALRSAEWGIEHETKSIARFSKAFKAIGERYFQFDSGAVDGRTYSKTGEFGQALKDAFNRATRDRLMDMAGGDSVQLATIGSAIKITIEAQIDKNKRTGSFSMYVEIMGLQLHVVTAPSLGEETDATGLARKVFNQINSVDSSLRTQRANLATHEADIIRLNKKLGAPFEYQQEMAEKYGELKRLEAELQGEGEKVAVPPSAGKKQGQEQDNPIQQAALSGALLGERQLARYDYQDVMARESGALPGESRFNQASGRAASTADRAVYDMAQEGKSAAEILSFIGKASRRPFNRYLANALKNLGASSTITLDSQGGWRFGNTSRAQNYAAAYNSRTDTVALFTAREAERHLLHELVHAATMKAIKAGGPAAVRMRALFKHAQKSGKVNGQYGMSNLDEFVAEAFTNPKFQEALKGVPAPAGSTLKSAWQWFVNIVSRVLGIRTSVARTALDRAMTIGAQLMRENAGIAAEETRYSLDGSQPFDGREVATTPLKPGTTTLMVDGTERPALNSNGKPIHWSEEGIRNFWRWFGDSKVVDARGRPLVVYHGSPDIRFIKEEAIFKSQKDRILLGRSEAAHWFSSDKRTAKSYADPRRAFDYQNSEEGVIESYLRIENPLVFHADGQEWKTAQKRGKTSDVIEEARASSKDGVIINNVRDDYNNSRSTRPTRTFTVFESTQIKSSTGNTGAFSPTDPDIRFSAGADWYNGPSGAPVRNAWQRAKAKAAEILSPKNLDKIIYELQDKHIDLRRLRDHIQAIGGTITDMNDAYLGEELYHKRLAHRTDEFLKTELRPLLAEMKARGVSIQDLETFLHARHAPEANAEMARRNPNQAEIDAGQKKSATLVLNLEKRLKNAKARGSATVAIEQALNDARGKLLQWNGAQAFRGTEEERRSLSGLSDADAAAIMNGLTPERRAAMDTLAARVDAINEGTLQHLQHYGLMSRESLDTWRKTYRYYVPLHRDEAHPDSANHPIGQGFSVKGDAAKRRTGSNQQVTNILGHIAMQREAALTRGEKNHVMRKLYLMARQNPLPDVWKVGEVPMIDTIDKATGFVRTVPDPLYKTRPNVIMLRIAGKDVAIVMNEHNPQALRMAQSLKNLDVDDLHYLIPVVGKMTRYFASINTQYNPIFGVINLMRDTQEAALNLSTTELAGKQKEVMTDTLSILKEVLKNKGRMPNTGAWATLFEEFNRVGGTTGYRDLFLDAESRSKSLLSELQALDRGKVSQAWNGVKEWLSDYNEAMENATRLAAYKAALDNGMSKERAASLAKNLTVNFNRKGRQTRELGALYAFFNAAVQGTTRMAQTLAGPAGRKIMAGGVMLGVMNALLGIAAMGGGDGDDDEWEKIPEFVKERSVVIPTGKDSYLAIPMPLGFQFLPNIGRLAVEMAVYKDKTAGKQMVALFQVLADAFNPMGGSSPPMQIAAPTVLDPFVALAQNKDWTGKPIYIENRSSLDPKPGLQRSKDSATPWAKGVAEAINAITGGTKYTPGGWSPTPDQIDFVIGQLTGGIGREAGKVAATATAPFTGEELPPYKIPLVGRLYGSTAGHSGQSEKFYENITKANEVENEIKGRVRDGISVAGYLADHPGATSLAARGNVAERQVSALRKARHAVTMKGGTDEASKVRVINERIANVMRNFNREADLIGKRFGQ